MPGCACIGVHDVSFFLGLLMLLAFLIVAKVRVHKIPFREYFSGKLMQDDVLSGELMLDDSKET